RRRTAATRQQRSTARWRDARPRRRARRWPSSASAGCRPTRSSTRKRAPPSSASCRSIPNLRRSRTPSTSWAGRPPRGASRRRRAGEPMAEQGDWSAARTQFAAVIQAGEHQPAAAPHVLRARLGLATARLQAGEREADMVDLRALARTSNRQVGAEAQLRIAESYFARGEFRRAMEEYLRVTLLFAGYPTWASQAQYQVGESYRRLGSAGEARTAYRKCAETYASTR